MDAERELTASVMTAADDIDAALWNACASGGKTRPGNPFLDHTFFVALETSGSARAETGWLPQHLVLQDATGTAIGIMPLYLKSHSQGEYVFDYGWADAFERAGGDYYPKLQCSVPFTPVTAPKLMVRDASDLTAKSGLLAAAESLCARHHASSVHATFIPEAEQALAAERGWLERIDRQFHWHNDGFSSYEDFLAALASRKRKALKKERRAALEDGIEIDWLTGDDITEAHWDAFFEFYMDTGSRKWGRPYLNRTFFSMLGEAMADRVLLIMARDGDKYIAGALNLIGDDTLYGRYWGCTRHVPFLHFEVCYYQAVDYAIEHGLGTVEAGAQGEHKLARGYVPVTTRSAHFIAHPGLRRAIADYLEGERDYMDREQEVLGTMTPFRKPD